MVLNSISHFQSFKFHDLSQNGQLSATDDHPHPPPPPPPQAAGGGAT